MKKELTMKISKAMGIKEEPIEKDINKHLKAVIINFDDGRGDIIVKNDNFKTRRKYPDFTNGKKEVGLHPFQIVFTSTHFGHICGDRYINEKDEEVYF